MSLALVLIKHHVHAIISSVAIGSREDSLYGAQACVISIDRCNSYFSDPQLKTLYLLSSDHHEVAGKCGQERIKP